MKKYPAKRKGISWFIIVFLLMALSIAYIGRSVFLKQPWYLLPLLSPLGLSLWLYFDTSYRIKSNALYYRSGFLSGKIDIQNIHQIIKGKNLWAGFKPALASGGLIVKYNRYDEIYIASVNDCELITDLRSINPKIDIIVLGK